MTITQTPNKNIWIAFIAAVVGMVTTGTVSNVAGVVFHVAILIWAAREVAQGVNWFRRLLGLAVIVVVGYRIIQYGWY